MFEQFFILLYLTLGCLLLFIDYCNFNLVESLRLIEVTVDLKDAEEEIIFF